MEEIIIKELTQGRRIYQKIIILLFKKLFIDIYKEGIKKGFNFSNCQKEII